MVGATAEEATGGSVVGRDGDAASSKEGGGDNKIKKNNKTKRPPVNTSPGMCGDTRADEASGARKCVLCVVL